MEIKIGTTFRKCEIVNMGMIELDNLDFIKAKVYFNEPHVYFFEPIGDDQFRLYSVIHKRSFYLSAVPEHFQASSPVTKK